MSETTFNLNNEWSNFQREACERIYAELEDAQEKKLPTRIISGIYKRFIDFFDAAADWAKEYIFRPFEHFIKYRIMRNTRENRALAKKRDLACPTFKNCKDYIIFTDDTVRQPKGVHQFYICRMIKDNGKVVYQKIGITRRDTLERMHEHLKKYWDEGVRKIVVDRVYDVKDEPEVTVESHFRALYGRKFKDCYVREDRFKEPVIDLDEADDEFTKFMMGY